MATFQSENITMTLAGDVLTATVIVGFVRVNCQYVLDNDPDSPTDPDAAGTFTVSDLEEACRQHDFDALGIVSEEVPISPAVQDLYVRLLMAALKFYTV
jgi:hypothetical protein